MKLITALKRAEAALLSARKRGAMRPRAQGICWTAPPVVIDPETLRDGEHIAVDVDVSATATGGYDAEGRWQAPTLQITQTERVCTDPADRGRVTRAGVVIGRVVECVGAVINLQYDPGIDPLAPPACEHCGRELGPVPAEHACARSAG